MYAVLGPIAAFLAAYKLAFHAWISATPQASPENNFQGNLSCVALGLFALLWLIAIGILVKTRPAPIAPMAACTACGYSRTGLDSDRCPECGEPFEV